MAPEESMGTEALELLLSASSNLGVELTEKQGRRLLRFLEELYDWNERLNLTRVPREEAIERHIVDSLTVACAIDMRRAGMALDIGTGAGLPGVALAVAFPHWHFDLIDGTRKKITFVQHVVDILDLPNIRAIHARAEDLARTATAVRRYDLVVARAVAPMSRLVRWMLPFVRSGGVAVAYKSGDALEEIQSAEDAVRQHGCQLAEVVAVTLPLTNTERRLAVMRRGEPSSRGRWRSD